MAEIIFPIAGMHCRSCELKIESELRALPGVEAATVTRSRGRAIVRYQGVRPENAVLVAAVERAGYRVERAGEEPLISRSPQEYFEVLVAGAVLALLFVAGKLSGVLDLAIGTNSGSEGFSFVFVLGLVAGISTCMAMIGGLTLGLSARFAERHPELSARRKFEPHIFFNLGRIGGFALLGALLGLLGEALAFSEMTIGGLSFLAGAVMLLIGLQLTGLFPRLSRFQLTLPKGVADRLGISGKKEAEYSRRRTILLGALTFFLPCGFTQSVQLLVVASGDPVFGAGALALFALGTTPGLLALGGAAAFVSGNFRRLFFRFSGVLVIVFAAVNIAGAANLLALGPTPPVPATLPDSREPDRVVRIEQRADGYFPAEIRVQAGERVRLIFDSRDSYSCATSLRIPKLGIRSALAPGENVFDFTADTAGTIPYSCSMGMYRGTITIE